jgi:integrase
MKATPFGKYVNETYKPTVLPLLATTTQSSYECTLRKYLMPVFERMPLREMTALTLQKFISGMGKSELDGDTILKIKEVLSSVLASAVGYDLLTKNPMLAVEIPRSKAVNKRKPKPHISPEDFRRLVEFVTEPYSTMIYIAVFTGLRVSELIGIRWEDMRDEALIVDERFCRGDWSVTKTPGSASFSRVKCGARVCDPRSQLLPRRRTPTRP